MKHYISNLRKVSKETLPKHKHSESQTEWEPLENQIQRWWVNLPTIMKNRRFQIVEIAGQCRGRFRDKPALRDVAASLRILGWAEARDWSKPARNRRYWVSGFTKGNPPIFGVVQK